MLCSPKGANLNTDRISRTSSTSVWTLLDLEAEKLSNCRPKTALGQVS